MLHMYFLYFSYLLFKLKVYMSGTNFSNTHEPYLNTDSAFR